MRNDRARLFGALILGAAFAVTFGSATLAVGDSWTETSSYGSDITVTIDNGMGAGNAHNGNGLLGPLVYPDPERKA